MACDILLYLQGLGSGRLVVGIAGAFMIRWIDRQVCVFLRLMFWLGNLELEGIGSLLFWF